MIHQLVGWDKETAIWWAGACEVTFHFDYMLSITCYLGADRRFRRPTTDLRTLVPPYVIIPPYVNHPGLRESSRANLQKVCLQ